MIKLGNNSIGKIYLGSNAIGKAYLGSNLVYQSGSPTPPGPSPVFYDYLKFDCTAFIETDIQIPENGSIRAGLGSESQKIKQRIMCAYTNGNYRWRGMVTHATGLNKHGWAMTVSAVGRYADEGVYPGSFYNSWGYFLAL